MPDNRTLLVNLQYENDKATGQDFPIGTGANNIDDLRVQWEKVAVPGSTGL
jgi:hypothetical protein